MPIIFLQRVFLPGVYVPIGGKQMITFMDDLNMPARDTFGSQPPLELIRQWIDYGFWFDRQKQTMKYTKVCFFFRKGENAGFTTTAQENECDVWRSALNAYALTEKDL